MTVKREALVLVGLVLVVKLVFTVVWTGINLAVVIRGLTRIRSARVNRPSRPLP